MGLILAVRVKQEMAAVGQELREAVGELSFFGIELRYFRNGTPGRGDVKDHVSLGSLEQNVALLIPGAVVTAGGIKQNARPAAYEIDSLEVGVQGLPAESGYKSERTPIR
jgi:hypothetical protein